MFANVQIGQEWVALTFHLPDGWALLIGHPGLPPSFGLLYLTLKLAFLPDAAPLLEPWLAFWLLCLFWPSFLSVQFII